jgi:hypothetical protein
MQTPLSFFVANVWDCLLFDSINLAHMCKGVFCPLNPKSVKSGSVKSRACCIRNPSVSTCFYEDNIIDTDYFPVTVFVIIIINIIIIIVKVWAFRSVSSYCSAVWPLSLTPVSSFGRPAESSVCLCVCVVDYFRNLLWGCIFQHGVSNNFIIRNSYS